MNVDDGERYRIALVSDFFCPNTGGVETHLYHLGECLLQMGHKVIVLTHAYGKRRGIRYLSNNLKVYYLPTIVVCNSTLASILGTQYFFRKIFRKEDIQIVHAHSSFSSMGHEALFHAWCMNVRTVFTEHSLLGFADASSVLMNKLLLKYSLSNVDRIICVSHTSKENTVLRARLLQSKVFVIPNAINTHRFIPDPQQFYGNDTTIIIICRLVYRKGIDLLVDVIPYICRRCTSVTFIIGGDGPKRIELEEMRERHELHSRVIMLGSLPHNKVRDVLVQGQIFLNTSLTEAFGMSIVEAASCGLHVVSTRVGGIPEVLPKELISLADPNPLDLSQAILNAIKLRENDMFVNPMEKHMLISRMYQWPDVARRTEIVYRAALCDRKVTVCERLKNYISVGFWFGVVWVWVALINVFLLAIFDFCDRDSVRRNNRVAEATGEAINTDRPKCDKNCNHHKNGYQQYDSGTSDKMELRNRTIRRRNARKE